MFVVLGCYVVKLYVFVLQKEELKGNLNIQLFNLQQINKLQFKNKRKTSLIFYLLFIILTEYSFLQTKTGLFS